MTTVLSSDTALRKFLDRLRLRPVAGKTVGAVAWRLCENPQGHRDRVTITPGFETREILSYWNKTGAACCAPTRDPSIVPRIVGTRGFANTFHATPAGTALKWRLFYTVTTAQLPLPNGTRKRLAPNGCGRVTYREMQAKRPIPSNIVVRGTNWVGDTVMSIPALRELRRLFPSSRISAWVPAGLVDLVRATGIPDDIISFHKDAGGPLTRPFKMAGKLASKGFDAAFLFQNAFESAFTATLARIPVRAGYPTDLRGILLTIRVPLPPEIRQKHQVFYYLGIVEFLERYFYNGQSSPHDNPDCSVLVGMEQLGRARDLLVSQGADITRTLFVLCPGSVNSEAKRWPAQSFAVLADLLIEHLDAQIVFLGAPNEAALINAITAAMKHDGALNLAGKSTIEVSLAVMNLSRLVISNDTGSCHLAVAASARVLTIFGPTSAGATAPYGPNAHIIQGIAPCAPCRHFHCPEPDHPCMKSIRAEAVLEKTRQILSGMPLEFGRK